MGWCYTKFARDQRSQLNTDILHYLFFAVEVLGRCLTIFNHISEVLISNADLRDLNSQSFRIKDSRKYFSVESFKRVSVLHKKYFQLQNEVSFSLGPKIQELFPFLLVPSLERSRITVWNQKNFKHLICIRSLKQVTVYREEVSFNQ